MTKALADLKTGYFQQLGRLFGERRYQIMLGLLLVMSWVAIDAYGHLVPLGLPITVIDHDNSKISRLACEFISANREIRIVATSFQNVQQAENALARGELAGVVYIPENFSRRIKTGRRGTINVSVDMANIVIGKNLYKAIKRSLTTLSVGVQMGIVEKMGVQKEHALSVVMPISVHEMTAFNPAGSYGVYIMAPMLFFFLHIYSLITALSLYLPLHQPLSRRNMLGAHAAIWTVCMAVGLLFVYVFLPIEGLPSQSSFFIVFGNLAVFFVLNFLFAAMTNALFNKPMVAFEATVIIGMLSLMFAGITWPTKAFPTLFNWASQAVPFTPFSVAYRMFLNSPMTWHDLAPNLWHYLVLGVSFTLLTVAAKATWALLRGTRSAEAA
ncbi:MAG: ABC transporter permease [Candidatus Lernaella stagnicola]|nr:ABC transporter permease [Candidatus Lernaella stagnicola]